MAASPAPLTPAAEGVDIQRLGHGLAQADLIVYNGAGMEGFIDGLKDAAEDEDRFLDLSQGLTLLESKDADLGDRSSSVSPWDRSRNLSSSSAASFRPSMKPSMPAPL